jgi:D-lactate dehydrogenase (cytochrome)
MISPLGNKWFLTASGHCTKKPKGNNSLSATAKHIIQHPEYLSLVFVSCLSPEQDSPMEILLNRLRAILDDKGLVTASSEAEPYLTESRGRYRSEASVIARPVDTDQVAAIVPACSDEKVSLVPQGGNTGLCGGAVAGARQLILSLERLDRVRDLDLANNTITVESGCILANLQQQALSANRYFPLSLGAEGSCQIGGNLATNAGGVNVLRYGNAREQVLGIEAVMPSGEVLSDLNGLRKNNTGYDLKQLLIGSEGTLGIITAAVLKLYPYPDHNATALVALRDLDASIELLQTVSHGSNGSLSSFELLPGLGMQFACQHIPDCNNPLDDSHDWYVLLSLQGSGAALGLDAMLQTLLALALEKGVIVDAIVASNETQAERLWRLRGGIVEAQRFAGGSIKHDISVKVSLVPEFIHRAVDAVKDRLPGIRPCPFGHVGDGNIHFNLSQPLEMDTQEYLSLWTEMNQIVFDIVADLGGSFSAEHGIGMLKLEEMQRYKDPVSVNLMQSLKKAIDPDSLFNPGKVLP